MTKIELESFSLMRFGKIEKFGHAKGMSFSLFLGKFLKPEMISLLYLKIDRALFDH